MTISEFATFTFPIQPALCIYHVFLTTQQYQDELKKLKGLFYKVNKRTFFFHKSYLIAFRSVQLSSSNLVNVSKFFKIYQIIKSIDINLNFSR